MMEIEKVAILGAGAMGAFFAAKFFEAGDFSVSLVAGGERYDRLKEHGLVVNGKEYFIPVTHPDEAAPPADLIIVALKHHHLAEAVKDLKNLVGEQTTILSVMNGLDSEEIIGSVYGMEKMLYTISVAIDAVREGNQVTYTNPGKHYFGEKINNDIGPKVRRVQAAFDRAGIAWETPVDMVRMLWWKFMVNVGMNQTSAAMQAPYGVFQTSPYARELMETGMQEVVVLAKDSGIDLTEKDIDDWYGLINTLSPQGKTSMLQDVEAGRKTEIEIFAGKVVELGKTQGIPTPVNETLFRIVRVLESRNEVPN